MITVKASLRSFHQNEVYSQSKNNGKLRLDRNESPLKPSNFVQEQILAEFPNLSAYPENSAQILREALAQQWGLNPASFLIGNGSFEILSLLAQVYLDEKSVVILPQGSFVWQEKFSRFTGALIKKVSLTKDYQIDLMQIIKAICPQTKLIWLTDPFNPTGTKLESKQLELFLEQVPSFVLVVIDEAYMEFAIKENPTYSKKWVQRFKNVILLRTFSKFYRLASLRIGYAVAQPEIIQTLLPYRIPPNHNRLGVVAAIASLKDTASHLEMHQLIEQEKRFLEKELTKLDFGVISSQTNFLFISLEQHPPAFLEELAQQVVFKHGRMYGYPQHYRITIGTQSQNRQLIAIIQKIINRKRGN